MFFKKNKSKKSEDKQFEKSKNELEDKIQEKTEEIELVRQVESRKREEIDSIKEILLNRIEQSNIIFNDNLKARENLVNAKLDTSEKELNEALEQDDLDKVKETLSKLL
jgi:ABC-type transport system involved in cytochrome bd biosynthesis fused ATPase/permease subunit